ncbi:heme binding [Salix suchowensis]|nr:heme binding [Salix suchowensis]
MKTVTLETNMGKIVLELYWDHAPKTCKNFAELAKRGYYNGTDFMVQGGDPTGTGRGGTSIYDEITPELRFTGAGILAMANSGPNTNGSNSLLHLLRHHIWTANTHIWSCRIGMRVVQRLGAVAVDAQDSGAPHDV